jgi:cytochrome c peroxidase
MRFLFDDLNGLSTQTLETNAFPWKVVTTALLLERESHALTPADLDELGAVFREFGFITPTGIANWPAGQSVPRFSRPMGFTAGTINSPAMRFRLEVANLSCAACHAGVSYDAQGAPQMRVWLGLPNTSVNYQAFAIAVTRALGAAARDPQHFLAALQALYPQLDRREFRTISGRVLPALSQRLAEIAATTPDYPLGFHGGASGLVNGLGASKRMFGVLPVAAVADDRGFTSVPDLSNLRLRSSAFWDGGYAPAGKPRFQERTAAEATDAHYQEFAPIMNAVTTPVMGIEPQIAVRSLPRVRQIAQFLRSYAPPRFPGAVDRERALRGREVFAQSCSRCHGEYSDGIDNVRLERFPNRLIAAERIGTDPLRARLVSDRLVTAFRRSPFAAGIDAAATGGYAAPPLNGLWATAPYLHNGSVPTLWDLLHPAMRPQRFWVGGHALDFARVGIALRPDADGVRVYAPGYRPWAQPSFYDTREPGQSNQGHVFPFEHLTEAEKTDLLEYLKLL